MLFRKVLGGYLLKNEQGWEARMTVKSLPDNTSGRKEKYNRNCRAFVRSSGFFLLPVLTGFPPFVLTHRFKLRRPAKLALLSL